VLLGLYRIRASLIADISLALFYVAGEGGAASAGVSRLDRVTVKCWPNTHSLRNPGQSRPPVARRHGCVFQMPVLLRPFPLKDDSVTMPQDQHNLI
jgi:hypothetical protein